MKHAQIETTLYSLSDDAPAGEERREGERHLTLYRVGALLIDGTRELCLVKNISCGGALVRAYSNLVPGQRIVLELKERQPIAGSVSWRRESDAGIDFDAKIDVLELLSGNDDEQRPRMPRVEVESVGFARQGAIVHRIHIKNISQGGLSAECKGDLKAGAEVTVTLPELPPVAGMVRWGRSGGYGISFNTVLALPTLVAWLQRHRTRATAA